MTSPENCSPSSSPSGASTKLPSTRGRAALKLAGEGWQVFPLHTVDDEGRCSCGRNACTGNNRGKHPRTEHGLKDATDVEDDILRWWSMWPDANIGVHAGDPAEGGSGVWSIDFDTDPQKGVDGLAVRAALEAEHGPLGGLVLQTGRGVQHVFEWTEECPDRPATDVAPGVDIRSNGSYFLAPPSRHYLGQSYRWLDGRPTPAPSWLLAWVRARSTPSLKESPDFGPHADPERIQEALEFCPGDEREDWLKVMLALKSSCLRNAYELFDEWSKLYKNYDSDENRRQWASAKPEREDGTSITIGTLFKIARDNGWIGDVWGDPVPLGRKLPEARFDPDALIPPGLSWLSGYVNALARSFQVPKDFALMPVMASLSSIVAPHYEIEVPREDWHESIMLWTLIVSVSGSRKTPIENAILKPFREWEEDPGYSERAANYRADLATVEAELRRLERTIKTGDTKTTEAYRQKRIDYERLKDAAPVKNEIAIRDATPQRLCGFLVDHEGRCLISDSEGDILHKIVEGHTGQQATMGDWLQCYDGNGLKQHRLAGDRIAEKADVAMSLLTQPDELAQTIGNRTALGRGLFARFLMIRIPAFADVDFLPGHKVPGELSERWRENILSWLKRPVPPKKCALPLSEAARVEFKRWGQGHVERLNKLVDEDLDIDERDPWQRKSAGRILRIAGVFSALLGETEVSVDTLRVSIRWAEPLEANFFSAMSKVQTPIVHQVAERILNYLRRKDLDGSTVRRRDIFQNIKGGRSSTIRKTSDLDEPLHELVRLGWLQGSGNSERGKFPSFHEYEVHPRLAEHFHAMGDAGDGWGTPPSPN